MSKSLASKIIVALDLPDVRSALRVASDLRRSIKVVKVGPELWMKGGKRFLAQLMEMGFQVFLDLKFHDIPSTVYRACRASAALGISMLTVHALGGVAMLQAALEGVNEGAKKGRARVLGVTVLTSLNAEQLSWLGPELSMNHWVKKLSRWVQDAGLDGVIASAQEASVIRDICGKKFLIVTPGIRLAGGGDDDQKRIATPQEAFAAGANYIVMGRPIFEAKKPREVIEKIVETL